MNSTYVVGVSGGSGSGKTSFVKALKKELGDLATFISQDDYYFPIENQTTDEQGVHNFDLPSSIDSKTMADEIAQIISGQTITRKEYTFENVYNEESLKETKNEHQEKIIALKPNPILVIEGLFCLHEPELRQKMDLTIFVDASDVSKLTRRIKRDRIERALPLEDVLYRYESHVLPSYKRYILPHKEDCDIVINNKKNFTTGLQVVSAFLKSKI